MLAPMIALAAVGIVLFFSAPLLARVILGRPRDPVALTRLLQVIAFGLLLAALLSRPYNPETRAVPAPPDAPAPRLR